jgi:hypothetical protein
MNHDDHDERKMDPHKMELDQTLGSLLHRHEEEGRVVHHRIEDEGVGQRACNPWER